MSLRVLVVTPSWPSPERPGDATFVRSQAEALAALGAEVSVLVPRPARAPAPRRWFRRAHWQALAARLRPFDPGPVPATVVPYPRTGVPGEDVVPAMGEALLRATEGGGPWDVLYAQWLWPGGAAALALRGRYRIPLAAMARGGDVSEEQWYGARADCRAWVARVLREADQPLANCRHLRRRLRSLDVSAGARARVIYNGLDLGRFRPGEGRGEARRLLGLGPGDRVAVLLGEISEMKGVPSLARAMATLRSRRPEWRLLLVGSRPEPATEAAVRAACGRAARLTGPVPPGDVPRILAAADAYVQPSISEGLANATLEAMAMALPVVTTEAAGQVEAVDGRTTGWLVPPGDDAALSRALEAIAADPEGAAARGRAARLRVERRFARPLHARRLLRILGEVAARGVGALAAREGGP